MNGTLEGFMGTHIFVNPSSNTWNMVSLRLNRTGSTVFESAPTNRRYYPVLTTEYLHGLSACSSLSLEIKKNLRIILLCISDRCGLSPLTIPEIWQWWGPRHDSSQHCNMWNKGPDAFKHQEYHDRLQRYFEVETKNELPVVLAFAVIG